MLFTVSMKCMKTLEKLKAFNGRHNRLMDGKATKRVHEFLFLFQLSLDF